MFALSEFQAHLTVMALRQHLVARGPALHAREDGVPEGKEVDVPLGRKTRRSAGTGMALPPAGGGRCSPVTGWKGWPGAGRHRETEASTRRGINVGEVPHGWRRR